MVRIKSNNGFSLVETIIAVSVFSVGVLGVLTMFYSGIKLMKSSQSFTVADQLAKEKIEEIVSLDYDDVLVGTFIESSLAHPFESYRRQSYIVYVNPLSGLQESLTDTGIKKIEVTVKWKSVFNWTDRNTKITTLIFKK